MYASLIRPQPLLAEPVRCRYNQTTLVDRLTVKGIMVNGEHVYNRSRRSDLCIHTRGLTFDLSWSLWGLEVTSDRVLTWLHMLINDLNWRRRLNSSFLCCVSKHQFDFTVNPTTHGAQECHSCTEQDRWFRFSTKTPYHNSPRQSSCHVLCAYCVMTYNTAFSKLLSWTLTLIYRTGFICLLKQTQISTFTTIQHIQHAEIYINVI